jgi:lipoprotein-releasing system permease protein
MYRYLICWRYLKSRYIALASIISVMLGVATMVVVNAVMAGFADTMKDRLHGILADIVVEPMSFDGFRDHPEVMAAIKEVAGGDVVAMSRAVQTLGLLSINYGGENFTRDIQLIGIDPVERAATGSFAEYLKNELGESIPPSFNVPETIRIKNPTVGALLKDTAEDDPFRPFVDQAAQELVPEHGVVLGWAAATVRPAGSSEDLVVAPEGAKVVITFPSAGKRPEPRNDDFTVVGYFKSGMSEYDSTHVYVPIERLQFLRGMGDGEGTGAINQIQLKCREGADLSAVARRIHARLQAKWGIRFMVQTWEEKQGPLLAAVAIEQNILNILLFLIIAVAGFGILAIFSMIVVEKTRDIGVLKALGASRGGIRGIFLAYGLGLGLVGSGVGLLGGLTFVANINQIEKGLSWLLGRKVFDGAIYYFDNIPTKVDLTTLLFIIGGALLIAVAASIFPAERAAKLDPVRALRYE